MTLPSSGSTLQRSVPEPLLTLAYLWNVTTSRSPLFVMLQTRWMALVGRVVTGRNVRAARNGLITLTCLDSLATWFWLHTGVAVEANPLVDTFIGMAGLGVTMTVRALWVSALIWALGAVATRDMPIAKAGLLFLYPFLGGVVLYHMFGGSMVWFGIWG